MAGHAACRCPPICDRWMGPESVQLVDEGVDNHQADEDDEHSQRPQPGCGARAECGSRYGPGGFGHELVALQMHDQLVLEALLRLQVALADRGAGASEV